MRIKCHWMQCKADAERNDKILISTLLYWINSTNQCYDVYILVLRKDKIVLCCLTACHFLSSCLCTEQGVILKTRSKTPRDTVQGIEETLSPVMRSKTSLLHQERLNAIDSIYKDQH